jgi:hypothetical protein
MTADHWQKRRIGLYFDDILQKRSDGGLCRRLDAFFDGVREHLDVSKRRFLVLPDRLLSLAGRQPLGEVCILL